jgi:hypothetical protein
VVLVEQLVEIAAILGALTGTAALIIQGASFYADRAEISLVPKMTVGAKASADLIEAMPLVDFELRVTNNGRRVAIVEDAGIHIRGPRRLFRWGHGVNISVFDPDGEEEYVRLHEGETKTFELRRWQDSLNNIAENMRKYELAYVRLTTGKEIRKRFKTVNISRYEHLKEKYSQGDA